MKNAEYVDRWQFLMPAHPKQDKVASLPASSRNTRRVNSGTDIIADPRARNFRTGRQCFDRR